MPDKANDRQVGGDHYKKFEYEPWDFFHEASIHPILAFAIKYIIRWRDKNGVADLEKAIHCLEKCNELEVRVFDYYGELWSRFIAQLPALEREILILIEDCEYLQSIIEIEKLNQRLNK